MSAKHAAPLGLMPFALACYKHLAPTELFPAPVSWVEGESAPAATGGIAHFRRHPPHPGSASGSH